MLCAVLCGPGLEPAFAAEENAGRQVYVDYGCHTCHGYEGQGALLTGPRIAPDPLPPAAFAAAIRHPRNEMPAYSPALLGDAEIAQMHRYLATRPQPSGEPEPGLFPDP